VTGRVLDGRAAVPAAERQFTATGDVDMTALARELSVSRATLYRVVGGRDRLLGDVLWERGRRSMRAARRVRDADGVSRVVAMARRFNEGVVSDAALQRFLQQDPATAFRVLFGREARVHVRFVELWRELLAEEVAEGRLPAVDVDMLAFLVVRLGESLLYADLLAGRPPDLDLAATAQRAVIDAAIARHADGAHG
jgi:AcrR family transcriptional regulator